MRCRTSEPDNYEVEIPDVVFKGMSDLEVDAVWVEFVNEGIMLIVFFKLPNMAFGKLGFALVAPEGVRDDELRRRWHEKDKAKLFSYDDMRDRIAASVKKEGRSN